MAATTGLRARKNLRVQEAIQRAALELALEQGFEQTTVAQIAKRADVAPRTVYTHFPTKEAIVLTGMTVRADALIEHLRNGPGGTADRFEAFVHEAGETDDGAELEHLRQRAMLADPQLRMLLRGQLDRVEAVLAEVISEEAGVPRDNAGARACAASAIGVLLHIQARFLAEPGNRDAILADTEEGLAVVRAGLRTIGRGES